MTKSSTHKLAIAALEAMERDQNTRREELNMEISDSENKISAIEEKFREQLVGLDQLKKALIGGERERINASKAALDDLSDDDLSMDGHNSKKAGKAA